MSALALAWTVIAVCLVVVLAGFTVLATTRTGKAARLKRRFGPEYDLLVERTGDRRQAESTLAEVVRTRESLPVAPLGDADRNHVQARWAEVQACFVDDPHGATDQADAIVVEVMTARGYRTSNPAFASDEGFDDRARLLACDYPEVTASYRSAHATRTAGRRAGDGAAGQTEQLRTAFVHYRSVFLRLVDAPDPQGPLRVRAADDRPADDRPVGDRPAGLDADASAGPRPISTT